MLPFNASPWFLLCEPKPPWCCKTLYWSGWFCLCWLPAARGSASTAKRPEEGRNLFMKAWACLHCSETPNSPFCCFMSVTGIPGRKGQDKRNTGSCEFRLRSCWHQVHGNVCVLCISRTPVQRQYWIKTYSSAAISNPALPIYQAHWGNWLELTLLTFLAVTSKVSFQTKPENPQLINKLFGSWKTSVYIHFLPREVNLEVLVRKIKPREHLNM